MATTSEAAAIIGVGYETLRNWLKRGLLAHAGEQERTWRRYDEADLCCLQLMKEGLAAGICTETMLDVCDDRELQRAFERLCARDKQTSFGQPQYVLVWATLPEALFMLAPAQAIPHELASNPAPMTVFDLSYIHSTVSGEVARRA